MEDPSNPNGHFAVQNSATSMSSAKKVLGNKWNPPRSGGAKSDYVTNEGGFTESMVVEKEKPYIQRRTEPVQNIQQKLHYKAIAAGNARGKGIFGINSEE